MTAPSSLLSQDLQGLTDMSVEQSLLGTLLAAPQTAQKLPPTLRPEHFSHPDHQEIFRAFQAVSMQGEASSFVVMQALRGSGIEAEYISSLISALSGPLMVHGDAHLVTDLWRRREMVRIAQHLSLMATSSPRDGEVAQIAASVMSELDAVAMAAVQQETMYDIGSAAAEALNRAYATANGQIAGTCTGYISLDQAIGPLEPGGLYVLAGRPGMGKTALALGMALGIAQSGAKTFYASLEMQAAQLGRRALSLISGVPQHVVKSGKYQDRDVASLGNAQIALQKLPLIIDQQSGVNTAMIALKARTAKRKLGGLDAIFVDHMHIVASDAQAERNGAARAVEKISNDLKKLAVDMECPVIALAQLNRGVEGRDDKRPSMADLRQSGAIEQDADGIMFVYRQEYYLPKSEPEHTIGQSAVNHEKAVNEWHEAKYRCAGKAEIIISKLREGEPCTVPMRFDAARTAFGDME